MIAAASGALEPFASGCWFASGSGEPGRSQQAGAWLMGSSVARSPFPNLTSGEENPLHAVRGPLAVGK